MDLRTRDRLTTLADLAPWAVTVLALAALVVPILVEVGGGGAGAQNPQSLVARGPVVTAGDPYSPGASLPEGFPEVDEKVVQVDQTTARTAAPRVVIVGDSLTVGASPGLRALLTDVHLRIDAKVGRAMPEGSKAAAVSRAGSADLVVVALGSNDSCAVAECKRRVSAILAAVNPAAPVVWMQPARFRPNMDNVRAAVSEVVTARPGSLVLDWQPFQDAHPEILQTDRIHLTPAGYRLRAEVTASQVHVLLPG